MKKITCLLFLVCFIHYGLHAQQGENAKSSQRNSSIVNGEPQPKGGMEAFTSFLESHQAYPEEAAKNDKGGTVKVSFMVTKSGKVISAKIEEGVNPSIDKEALRLIHLSEKQPGWIPGQQDGRSKAMRKVVSVTFKMGPKERVLAASTGPLEIVEETVKEIPVPEEEIPVNGIYERVDEGATPEGGMDAYYQVIFDSLHYPSEAIKAGVEGRIFVDFVVDEEGNVRDAKVVEGREIGFGIDEEAIRLIKLSKWIPAKKNGKVVKQRLIMPILFRLP